MEIKKITDFGTDENCYVLYNEKNSGCVVIDPGNIFEKLDAFLSENGLSVRAVLLTHCHYDHVSGILKLKEKKAEVLASERCRENIKDSVKNVSLMFGENFSGDFVDRVLSDSETFNCAGIDIKCIYTPGHTDCSVCYLVGDKLFSGDTLFLRTTGRWDLPTGNYEQLSKSLKEKIYLMDDNIKVFPGHGGETTVGYEKKFNMSINME